ncbi:hypothetical protein [Dyella humicola]|uniref:hypothetical protein n=1 Tax=Dyella humicola TaxID=2992126 RepID=UPI00225C190A|nr:hypothetical protein [Dyella humicola]
MKPSKTKSRKSRNPLVLGLLFALPPAVGWSAAGHAHGHVASRGHGECALHVRRAVEAAGIALDRTPMAKDMGSALRAAGFHVVQDEPQRGDVVVIQPAPGHPQGHAARYDGHYWVSDFRQLHGIYPGPDYRDALPSYQIYRHD